MKGTVGGDARGRGVVQGRANGEKASGGRAPEVHCSSPRDLRPASPFVCFRCPSSWGRGRVQRGADLRSVRRSLRARHLRAGAQSVHLRGREGRRKPAVCGLVVGMAGRTGDGLAGTLRPGHLVGRVPEPGRRM